MSHLKAMFIIVLISAIVFDITDLIRGHYFYNGIFQIIYWNVLGIMALIGIIQEYKEKKLYENNKQ